MRQGKPFVERFEIRTPADIAALESVPIEQRLEGLDSTYDVIVRTARRSPDSVALAFVPDGDPSADVNEITYQALLQKVTQAANAFHALGIGPTTSSRTCCPTCSKRITRSGAARRRAS